MKCGYCDNKEDKNPAPVWRYMWIDSSEYDVEFDKVFPSYGFYAKEKDYLCGECLGKGTAILEVHETFMDENGYHYFLTTDEKQEEKANQVMPI